jgi:hypothetical protein
MRKFLRIAGRNILAILVLFGSLLAFSSYRYSREMAA